MGRSRRVQDLLFQTIRENAVALAVVAESYRVLDAPDWTRDTDEIVAVTWASVLEAPAHGGPLERGNGYVAVEWAGMVGVGVYVLPNCGWVTFEEFLDGSEGGTCAPTAKMGGQGKERRSTPGRGLGPRDFSYLNFMLFCVAFECNIFILHIKGIKFR